MKVEHRGRKPNLELKKKIAKYVDAGVSFEDIKDIPEISLKSRQLVRYHYLTLKKLKKSGI